MARKTDESLLLLMWSGNRIDHRDNRVAEAEDYPDDGHALDRHIDRPDRVHAGLPALEERPSSVVMVSITEVEGHCLQEEA